MVLGKLDSHMGKTNLIPTLQCTQTSIPYELQTQMWTKKQSRFPKKNNLKNLNLSKDFLNRIQKVILLKEKNENKQKHGNVGIQQIACS